MKRLIIILLALLPFVTNANDFSLDTLPAKINAGTGTRMTINALGKPGNVIITTPVTPPAPYQYILIVFFGESNSGGQALNTSLTSGELAIRPGVQILNNTTLLLESLDIGTNNNLGHTGLSTTIYHGWENGLAHQVENSDMHDPTVLAKCGQGGSTISQWDDVDAYYITFKARVDAAVSLVTTMNGGTAPKIYFWFSLGINDAIATTNVATFKTGVTSLINRVRTLYGSTCPFLVTELPNSRDAYNTPLYEIASELTRVHMIETSDLTPYDGNHWNAADMRTMADRFITSQKANYTF